MNLNVKYYINHKDSEEIVLNGWEELLNYFRN